MKYLIPIILLSLMTSGCARQHSYQLEGESLTLSYRDKDAAEIIFASSLDNYSYHAATKTKNNVWKVSVPAVEGFNYFYIVDGRVTLPDCRYKEQDDFGSKNCLFVYEM